MTIDLRTQDDFDYVAKVLIDILKVHKVRSYMDFFERSRLEGTLLQLMVNYSGRYDTTKWLVPYSQYVEHRKEVRR